MPGPSDSDYSRLPSELLDLQAQLDDLADTLQVQHDTLLSDITNYPIFVFVATQSGANFEAIAGPWARTVGDDYATGVHLHKETH